MPVVRRRCAAATSRACAMTSRCTPGLNSRMARAATV